MHKQFLLAALEQARLGLGQCAPNPCVGAVAVQNKKIIAQAFHQGAGTPHAEQLLLAQLEPKMPGVSVYVTLEPCNHWGKTPPCVNALIDYGVEEVVFGFYDPNPVVARNDSSALLKQQGIKVTHFPLHEIDAFYTAYAFWVKTKKPFVMAKIAQSLDGKIGYPHQRVLLSNELCASFTHTMRAANDLILTTAQTIHCDNPQMNVRLQEIKAKPVAVIDSLLSLTSTEQIFSTASQCHIFHRNDVMPPAKPLANCTYYPVSYDKKGLQLSEVIKTLGLLGFHSVWVEAGGRVFSRLHEERLINKTYVYITPSYLGEKAIPAYQNTLFNRKHEVSWQIMGNNVVLCMDWQEE
ncbi:MAG: riboflavin biosynthesis protein RibD [Legionella sp.]|nr:MAG: riboflavin biosynthesis protein RibD [Legionella sp.]PJD99351.1 MAG: riboflavin biosynthesis protein RibD [Legionella sp.]